MLSYDEHLFHFEKKIYKSLPSKTLLNVQLTTLKAFAFCLLFVGFGFFGFFVCF